MCRERFRTSRAGSHLSTQPPHSKVLESHLGGEIGLIGASGAPSRGDETRAASTTSFPQAGASPPPSTPMVMCSAGPSVLPSPASAVSLSKPVNARRHGDNEHVDGSRLPPLSSYLRDRLMAVGQDWRAASNQEKAE